MTVKIINADVLEGLRTMEDESIQCAVTSPPYYALRDYGTGEWEGGDPDCNHQIIPLFSSKSTIKAPNHKAKDQGIPYKHRCGKCGAIRKDQQIGLEETPQDYIDKMVEVCREIRRVLRHDGTFWLNIGDSYCSSTFMGNNNDSTGRLGNSKEWKDALHTKGVSRPIPMGLKPKDMMGIPWRLAIALQADGWYLRQDIIWHKPNPMPESVTDRCTKAHEYIFLLTKSAQYYYDAEAIKDADANKRDVWTITVKAFKEAHFATFPPELPRLCILAGTSEKGACPKCGSPWERIQSRIGPDGTEVVTKASTHSAKKPDGTALMGNNNQHSDTPLLRTSAGGIAKKGIVQKETVGWAPTCECGIKACAKCGSVIDLPISKSSRTTQGDKDESEKLRVVRGTGSPVQVGANPHKEVLLQSVCEHTYSQEPQDDERMDQDQQGLRSTIQTGLPNSDQGGIRDGASLCGGTASGPSSNKRRGGSPQEREQVRQRDSELGGDALSRAQRSTEDSHWRDNLSSLPSDGVDIPTCPSCGSNLAKVDALVPAVVPCKVFDPFGGSGTTAMVANRLGRDAVFTELNPEYCKLAENRIHSTDPLYVEIEIEKPASLEEFMG